MSFSKNYAKKHVKGNFNFWMSKNLKISWNESCEAFIESKIFDWKLLKMKMSWFYEKM